MRGERDREPWSFAADELSSSHFSAWSYQNQQLPCCCEYHLTLEDRYIVFMFAADLPSSSSSSSSSVEEEKKVTANLLVQYLFVCCFVSFWDILVG
jgi:hypothetical protein